MPDLKTVTFDAHEVAMLVNLLRDTAIEFRDAQQLRARIAEIIVPLFEPAAPTPAAQSAGQEAIYQVGLGASWRDVTRHDFGFLAAEGYRTRIVYVAPVNGGELLTPHTADVEQALDADEHKRAADAQQVGGDE
ncbi:hypothetical protein [Pandoraea sp. SD6-2]|uniref:hypothetical protein n=1 Tax=Pandoraea sp. SD6-2 TaxID=1286093 RepID=UPI00032F23A2|nr:hypothetical protein [Pandoraea sp. SD6-2]EON13115.1 hypothetical protein C266_13924 [Pandoraea sp. SD6-2]